MLNAPSSTRFTPRASFWMKRALLGLGALAIAGVATGQGQRPDATLDELVVEVQAMRAEMNQAAAASIRAQLLVGRLQMEDQRIAGVVRELDAVQADLAGNAQARAEAATRLRAREEAVLGSTNDERDEAEKQLDAARV